MGTKMNEARLRDQVYGQWSARPPGQRTREDTYGFIDELWSSGVKLGASQSLHYQHVMDVIRAKITE